MADTTTHKGIQMNYVEERAQLIQRLQKAATDPDSVTVEVALNIYKEVYEQVYYYCSNPGIKTPTFWNVALELAGVLVFSKRWEEISRKVKERITKQTQTTQTTQTSNTSTKTEVNDNGKD